LLTAVERVGDFGLRSVHFPVRLGIRQRLLALCLQLRFLLTEGGVARTRFCCLPFLRVLIAANRVLTGPGFLARFHSHLGGLRRGLGALLLRLGGLRVGDRVKLVGLLALLGLGLLDLALRGQFLVLDHGADVFFRLAFDGIYQSLACLVGLVVLGHRSFLTTVECN
jgi:hypothetical protein